MQGDAIYFNAFDQVADTNCNEIKKKKKKKSKFM